MSMASEFKEFALKGNVMDLAVGVIIGGAFGRIVTSMVEDLIMPVVGLATGGIDFSNKLIILDNSKAAGLTSLADLKKAGVPVFAYGSFLTVLLNFLILAFIIFQMVKMMNRMKHAQPAPAAVPPATPEDILLLREIRDQLRK